jgi:4-amino-4-deoxy-L-arabinose transferase-like glycosyltransferase
MSEAAAGAHAAAAARPETRPRALRRRRLPIGALTCAAVAVCASLAWSFVTPAFRVPDEIDHYRYVEQLVEDQRPPTPRENAAISDDIAAALRQLRMDRTLDVMPHAGIWSELQERRLAEALAVAQRGDGNGVSYGATPQPPLYYALETAAYELGRGQTLLQRLSYMRWESALLAGVTVLFVFLFLRELLPGWRWAWSVGALCVALNPLFGYMSGGVNPDALLYAVSAALFYVLARGFRRGLTPRLALAFGAVVAAGMLGKSNFVGLLPGAVLGLTLLTVRARRTSGVPLRDVLRLPAIALVTAAVPIALVAVANVAFWNRPAVGLRTARLGDTADGSLSEELNYIWQLFLPPLPGTQHLFPPGLSPTRQLWIDGFVGRFGLEQFPDWAFDVALVVLIAIALLALRGLFACRHAVRARWTEAVTWSAMTAGVFVVIGLQSYSVFAAGYRGAAQTRYLLPLLALYALTLVLAARGSGRRWAPTVGVVLVLLALAHGLFGQLLMISRFYT